MTIGRPDPFAPAPGSAKAAWALGLSLAVMIPGLPLVGMALGVWAWTEIARSPVRRRGKAMAAAAVIIGAIFGVVSVLAYTTVILPGLRGGSRDRKVEVELNLHAIERGVYRANAASQRFPRGATTWTPSQPCCATDPERGICTLDASDWTGDRLWRALGFVPGRAPMHQYRYRSTDGRSFVLEARGDADCDGEGELVTLSGSLGPTGNATTDPLTRTSTVIR